jgi:hypothetical protein
MTYYKKIKKVSKIIYINTDNASYVDGHRKEFTFRVPPVAIEDKSRLYVRQYSNDYRGSGIQSLSIIAGTGTPNTDICFVTVPTISFVSSNGTGASAIAYMKPTSINGTVGATTANTVINVVAGGTGYCGDPANMITVNNAGTNGTGCTITPTVTAGVITAIAVATAGKGYSTVPTYTIAPPQATQVVAGTATISSGAVTGVTISNATTNGCYTSSPTLVFNHTQVEANITYNTNSSGVITSLTVTNPTLNGYYGATTPLAITVPAGTHIGTVSIGTAGAGYNTAPTVTIQNGSGGRDGVITSTVSAAGVVNALTIVNRGTGYTGTPTLLLSAPDARTAKVYFTTSPSGIITSIVVEDGGGYYTATPTLTIPASFNGIGAQVAPTMTITMSGTGVGTITTVAWTAGTGTGYLPNLSRAYFTATEPTRTQATATLTIGGSGAVLSATVASGRISAVSITTAGTNYLPSQTGLLATPPPLVVPTQPSGGLAATIALGRITAFAAPTTGGVGFINTTTITPSGGTVAPTQASGARITLLATSVAYVRMLSSGYGYTQEPIAIFEAPPTSHSTSTSTYIDGNASPPLLTCKLNKEQEGNRMIVKLRGVQYNNASYYNTDGSGDPTICTGYINGIEMDDGDQPMISIPAQTFDSFTLIFSDKYGNGIGNSKINMAIGIEELDPEDRSYIDMKRQDYVS